MLSSLSDFDLRYRACPEHEEAEDYADIVKRFCDAHQDEIDQLLELCADLNRAGENEGLDRGEFPGCIVAEFVATARPGFKATDRLSECGKRKGTK